MKIDNQIDQRSRAIETFGNLTLVNDAINPSLGNAGWDTKKERLSRSLLALNRFVSQQDKWDEETISERGADLAKVAIARWSAQ